MCLDHSRVHQWEVQVRHLPVMIVHQVQIRNLKPVKRQGHQSLEKPGDAGPNRPSKRARQQDQSSDSEHSDKS